ncbi:unnamed protein product [Rotaria magnacalcarata]|uniref:Uncharacterized protein n=2 Tax=Rotaria magnacalcarata TaxID=392030 RepID=A0A815DR62_9BILA|nr:unnamed protein product [Rotaria magnacalcarata]CAF2099399.1 unnamed protein product [Rotaria magnacalcarata]CAF4146229.1 unnamed protein product [Rotaria magnacalcarata]
MYQKLIIQLYGQLAIRYIFHPISVQSVRQYDFLKIPLSQEQHFLFCYSPNQQNVEISPNRLSNNADEYELTNLVLTAIYYTLFGLRHCAFRGKYFRLGTIHEGSASCNIACNSELSTIDNGRKLYTIRSAISLVKSIDQSLVKGNLVAELDPRICNVNEAIFIDDGQSVFDDDEQSELDDNEELVFIDDEVSLFFEHVLAFLVLEFDIVQ